MKEAFGGVEFGPTEMCFPSPGLDLGKESKVILRHHYCLILAASLEKIDSRILGVVRTICLII